MLNILKKQQKIPFNKKSIKRVPEATGIYLYWSEGKKLLYVGKAVNLRKRLMSYFLKNLGEKTNRLVKNTKYFSYIKVNVEIEALLLEARLIGKLKPIFNSSLKDDKKPLYIRITGEKYPRVLTARKKDANPPTGGRNLLFIGPFPSSYKVKSVLKLLRKIIPYSQHKLGKRGCLYSQMGLCKPCPNEIEKLKDLKAKKQKKEEYLQNIRLIKGVLTSRFTFVRKSLEKKMRNLSKAEKYEEAAYVRNQINMLDYITRPVNEVEEFIKDPNLLDDLRNKEIKNLRMLISKYTPLPQNLSRIECYDVAHLAGTNPTASMVTFINGEPNKTYYRHFKIRKPSKDDIFSMKQVAERREKYLADWGTPDLIIVDGGKAQVSVFRKVFKKHNIPVVGLAKRNEKLVIPVKVDELSTHSFIELVVPKGCARNLVQRLRDEAHRFARRYHHKLLQKELIPS